ncbi:MAG TPA: endonuclease III, partial [Planctomycetaceae bacterium]|nr:endonuclease III [Planctomycetaceae bacterium]
MPKSGRASHVDDRKPQALKIARALAKTYADAVCALHHDSPFQLLIATILSAQCTDERVNMVTPALFARYPTPVALAAATPADVEAIIQSTGFFRAKAANLVGMAQGLMSQFGGELPRTLEEMTSLPG